MKLQHKINKYIFKFNATSNPNKKKLYAQKINKYTTQKAGGPIIKEALQFLPPSQQLAVDRTAHEIRNVQEPRTLLTFGTDHKNTDSREKLLLLKNLLSLSAESDIFAYQLDISYKACLTSPYVIFNFHKIYILNTKYICVFNLL
jgi:hypothetical protein